METRETKKKNMTKIKIYALVLLNCTAVIMYGQKSSSVTNEGVLSLSPGSLMTVEGSFKNTETGNVTNDGTVIYFQHFSNDGLYGITKNQNTSKTFFEFDPTVYEVKVIEGNGTASFYDVSFNNPADMGFELKQNIDVYGTADFQEGIINVDSTYNPVTNLSYGMVSFHNGSSTVNVRDEAFVDGMVEKIGNEGFTYPNGHKGRYRYSRISAPSSSKDAFVSQYVYKDKAFFESRPNSVGVINTINTNEYWLIEKSEDNVSDVLLTLSWDEATTLPDVLLHPEEDLHVVRWDPKQQLWVDEGGVVDMSRNEVTTIATVKGYGFFTLGTVKKDWILDGDVVIYNLVTPDGDGKNDYFIIDHINNYPNNKVEIFNRWGARVYETKGYDPNGDGSSNVFRGYSEGKVTIDKGAKLPSGTYYYVITYEYTDENGSRMIKKAANLHLENN